jgi:hypothetical protein
MTIFLDSVHEFKFTSGCIIAAAGVMVKSMNITPRPARVDGEEAGQKRRWRKEQVQR